MEHSGEKDIAGVFGPAGHFFERVFAPRRFADNIESPDRLHLGFFDMPLDAFVASGGGGMARGGKE